MIAYDSGEVNHVAGTAFSNHSEFNLGWMGGYGFSEQLRWQFEFWWGGGGRGMFQWVTN